MGLRGAQGLQELRVIPEGLALRAAPGNQELLGRAESTGLQALRG